MSKPPIVERCIGRADTLEALGRENRPLTSEHDVAAVVLTREILRDAATTITELVSALREAEAILHNCHVTEGVCCCGEDMERHANPMDCGHTPVDHGSYVANQWLEDHASLLAKLEQSQ